MVITHLQQNIFQTDLHLSCRPFPLHLSQLREHGLILYDDTGKFHPCCGRNLEIWPVYISNATSLWITFFTRL